ncbi:MAG: hypothetical protein JXI33_03310 [Candidatus Aminicenantes bacterium]|nr:hypothetical protein [Candidatus Aminicenantes bacterium]
MSAKSIQSLIQSWETVRFELLNSRISDLNLKIFGSPVEPLVRRLHREMEIKGFRYKPNVYLTDSWGCPDRSPIIGIPFYLADERLARIEAEQTGEIEDSKRIMALLRHEAGHAVNYAYRLWRRPSWEKMFGRFMRPYRDVFRPDLLSREYVKHLSSYPYGRTYAQKHPDEDFAETFAVWLTPRSGWRYRYRNWPVMKKLQYVGGLMKEIRHLPPENSRERLLHPVDALTILLAVHYGKKAGRFRRAARGYVDDRLREVFPPVRGMLLRPASVLLRKLHSQLLGRVILWSKLSEREAAAILRKLETRADALKLSYRLGQEGERIMDVVSLAVALALDYAYTGRLTG